MEWETDRQRGGERERLAFVDDALKAYTKRHTDSISQGPDPPPGGRTGMHIRMTEKRRLATAAAAMMARMMTFNSVLVLSFLPSETSSSVACELAP